MITAEEDSLLKDRIVILIQSNHSSINLLAEYLEADVNHVRSLIIQAVDEGLISGWMTEDELRFYRSDVKLPDPTSESEEVIETTSLLIPKLITIGGIALFIAGQVIFRMTVEGTALYNMSTALIFGGLFTIFGGLYSFSRFD
ncbi:MAG: hypothetical protein ACXAEF_06700 [Candidatus Thorarchaeota archaeon]